MRSRTASSSDVRSRSTAWSNVPWNVVSASTGKAAVQKARSSVPSREIVLTWPGSSSVMPAKTACGATLVQNVKVSAMPTGSSRRGIDASPANRALTSLANHSRPPCSHR